MSGSIFDRVPAVEPLLPATSERYRANGHACTLDLAMEATEPVSPPPFRSERFVCSVAVENGHFKIVQLVFQKSDGSVLVTFPYGPECDGLVSVATISAHGSQLDLKPGGKVTSHLVKYAHHPDGEAHFSQTGKVLTRVRRRAVRLDDIGGHLFTVHVTGYETFRSVPAREESTTPNAKRTLLTFNFATAKPRGIKLLGRAYTTESFRSEGASPPTTPGPVWTVDDAGASRLAFLTSSPAGWPGNHRIIMLIADAWTVADVSSDPHVSFIGGFDREAIARDPSQPTTVLAMSYPVESPDELRRELGTIDLV